jgi:hypothetical protein
MEEPVFVEKTMEHTSVDFLFFNDLRFFEVLHSLNEFLDSCIDFRVLS